MLTEIRLAKLGFLAAVLMLTGLVVLACRSNQPEGQPEGTGASIEETAASSPTDAPSKLSPTPSEVISSGTPAFEIAKSLRAMVEKLQTVVVGRVVGVEGQFYEYIPAPDGSAPLGGWPMTISLVEVIKVIHASRVKEGQTIRVVQAGGTLPDGRTLPLRGRE